MSAGLSGAFAARGVGRGDVVMTLAGNRLEWVLAMLACWRMGAVALPCNTQLRRHDLELRVGAANPMLCVGEEELLGELPGGVEAMTMAEVARALDEDLAQETPAAVAELDGEDPALIVFTSGTTGEPRPALHTQRYLPGQPHPGRALARRPRGRSGLVHDRDRMVEVGSQRLPRAVALRRGGDDRRRSLRPADAARARRARARRRPLPGADRVPDPRRAHRAAAGALAAADGLRRGGARPRGDRGLPRGHRARDPRRLRADRDWPADRQSRRRGGPRRLDGKSHCRASSCGSTTRSSRSARRAARPSFAATSTASRSPASGGRPATSSAPTRTATSGTRAGPTT